MRNTRGRYSPFQALSTPLPARRGTASPGRRGGRGWGRLPAMTVIRRGDAQDVARAARTLALAFEHGPWTEWTVSSHHRLVRLEALFRHTLREIALPDGELWIADDGGAAAAWVRPGYEGVSEEVAERLAPEIQALQGDRREAAEAADLLLATRRPVADYWYLASVGTRPERRREGLGRRVLAPVLERCDAEGQPAYLETSTESNLRFYDALGFRVLDRFEIPGGGPTVWQLWRDPR